MNKYLNILFLIILLLVVFLARQPFLQKVWPNIYENVIKPAFEKIVAVFQKHIISRITKEVEKRKEIVESGLSQITESILKNIKNFFLNQFKKIFE